MGKGRKPCCDKESVKKGPWSEAEDIKLISFIQKHGHSNWRALPRLAGLARCGKSCRLRWVNYLRPDLKRGQFTPQEEEAIIKLHEELGNKWSKIASNFPGRTDNEIKNVWNTHLKKRRLIPKQHNKASSESCNSITTTTSISEILDESNKNCLEKVLIQQTNTQNHDIVEPSSSSCSNTLELDREHPYHQLKDNNPKLDGDKDEISLEELIEIPFEPNLDLWDLLEGDQSNSADYNDQVQFNQGHDTDTPLCPIFEKDTGSYISSKEEDSGSWWWLVYLENELGLTHNEAISTQSTIGSNDHELLFKGK